MYNAAFIKTVACCSMKTSGEGNILPEGTLGYLWLPVAVEKLVLGHRVPQGEARTHRAGPAVPLAAGGLSQDQLPWKILEAAASLRGALAV